MKKLLFVLLTVLACTAQAPKGSEFEIIPIAFSHEILIRQGNHSWQVLDDNVDQAIENIKETGSPWATKRIDAPGAPVYDSTGTSVDLTVPFSSPSSPDGGIGQLYTPSLRVGTEHVVEKQDVTWGTTVLRDVVAKIDPFGVTTINHWGALSNSDKIGKEVEIKDCFGEWSLPGKVTDVGSHMFVVNRAYYFVPSEEGRVWRWRR
jgi:hypothetical protein